MLYSKKLVLWVALALPCGVANAHGFNIAPVIPLSGAAAADGHLGGLDVHVDPVDSRARAAPAAAPGYRAARLEQN